MKWPWKRTKNLTYKFLCKTCDVFFTEQRPHKNKCPVCGRPASVYDVYESKREE